MKRQWLADIRTRQGKTQQEVADSANMTQSGYAGIETGAKTPTVSTAKRIAAVLGFDWTRFFEDAAPRGDEAPADGAGKEESQYVRTGVSAQGDEDRAI